MYGFSLALRTSELQGGGSGVFVSSGVVPEGHIVGLYPGRFPSGSHDQSGGLLSGSCDQSGGLPSGSCDQLLLG